MTQKPSTRPRLCALLLAAALFSGAAFAQDAAPQTAGMRVISGTVVTARGEVVVGVTVAARADSGGPETPAGGLSTETDGEGKFRLVVPANENVSVRFYGAGIALVTRVFRPGDAAEDVRVEASLLVTQLHETVVVISDALDAGLERRNATVFEHGLFARDDQLLQTLAAGIDAGQHEGGGKSLEVRRYGFNLDHGGVGGGLRVLVDGVQQNQSTQGHGQGYLGALKSVTPELVRGVEVVGGPFDAREGDFSGLGVVRINLRESLPRLLTARFQLGSFETGRAFVAYSPALKDAAALFAYEGTRTDGPFLSPLRYARDNLTGNYTRRLDPRTSLSLKLNFGRNDFNSSGQIPLDEVAAGRLDRFGFVDPDNGGRVRGGTLAARLRREWDSGRELNAGASLSRTLFDLWSNFTFFLADERFGDEVQQHDSRLQQSADVSYVRPYKLAGHAAALTVGANFHAAQVNVGLYPSAGRAPGRLQSNSAAGIDNPDVLLTDARARVTNVAAYAQHGVDLLGNHLHFETGLRLDHFRFGVDDLAAPANSGARSSTLLQPKVGAAYRPSHKLPVALFFNYGRGVSSQDARGVARDAAGPAVSTTDFYQLGTLHNLARLTVAADLFLIDRSREQVYVPDDGSIELTGPSRSYGFELRASAQLARRLALDAGLTRVMNAFFRGTAPRVYLDGAPHAVANASLTLTGWRGANASLRYRHASGYRLDGADARVRAAGHDVVDFGISQRLRPYLDLNFSLDNLTGKRYFETQNFFESRLRPGGPAVSRIHATPGYPRAVTAGLTFRFFEK
ncbi:MAG: TonB-dependent receptor [Acidobacteria bacterium]|nr:TonB-dependent receptor [Acidobacteriota bacterium]